MREQIVTTNTKADPELALNFHDMMQETLQRLNCKIMVIFFFKLLGNLGIDLTTYISKRMWNEQTSLLSD